MLAVGGYYIYVSRAFFKYCPGLYLAGWHRYSGSLIMLLCYYSFYKACTVEPGVIQTKEDAQKASKLYEYDNVMYKPDNICETCQIIKPARSKHCKICDLCVEKLDHHCVWLNQCVGRKNYKWFLIFLFLHAVICLYGFSAGFLIYLGEKKLRDDHYAATHNG